MLALATGAGVREDGPSSAKSRYLVAYSTRRFWGPDIHWQFPTCRRGTSDNLSISYRDLPRNPNMSHDFFFGRAIQSDRPMKAHVMHMDFCCE